MHGGNGGRGGRIGRGGVGGTSQIFGVWGDDTIVYAGHGDDITLGAERPFLHQWRERGW